MGHSKAEKAESRARILEVASERLRGEGLAGPGVAEMMRAAGLTHGGFYKHFGSRDELVAEALTAALDAQGAETMAGLADSADPLGDWVALYASAQHCEHPESGCAIAAVAGEVARGDDALRDVYTERISGYVGAVDGLLERSGSTLTPEARRRAAMARYAMLVGAITLARAVNDDALRDELLAAAREAAATAD